MDVKKVCDRECIQCGECMHHCPVDAIYIGIRRIDRKKMSLQAVFIVLAVILIVVGLNSKGFHDIKSKAIRLCYECMGIG